MVFESVELELAEETVEWFREEAGLRGLMSWRGMAEKVLDEMARRPHTSASAPPEFVKGGASFQVRLDEEQASRLAKRAERAGYEDLASYGQAVLASSGPSVAEDMCFIAFQGVPEVFYGPWLDEALRRATMMAEASGGFATVMSVTKEQVEIGLARQWVGVVPTTLAKALEYAASHEDSED